MTKKLPIVLFLLLFGAQLKARQDNFFDTDELSISWQLLENNYKGKRQMLALLEIKNNSKSKGFPGGGWELYFNQPGALQRIEEGNVHGEFLGGDFNKIWPAEGFGVLAPGGSLKICYVSGSLVKNIDDAPSGLYFVWKGKTYPIKNYRAMPISVAAQGTGKAAALYQKYQTDELAFEAVNTVFPTPASVLAQPGELAFGADFRIYTDDAFTGEAQLLADDISVVLGRQLPVRNVATAAAGKNTIVLKKACGLAAEAYELHIGNDHIEIRAGEAAGAFYGIKSLVNLFPAKPARSFKLKAQVIKDQPRFGYRAFMMDVARNFQPKEQVKRVLDLMAAYKLNVLHFHLNDDEGWRLAIPSLPELTEVGARRAHPFTNASLMPSYGSGGTAGNPFGTGFYSREDFIEILTYAKRRHIRVIPEIETPGHARAAIKSMLYRYEKYMAKGDKKSAEEFLLHEIGDPSEYRSAQGFSDNIINAALPSVYRFIATVADDIIAMYKEAGAPLHTIHMGGDEVPKGSWEKSRFVQELISKGEIADVNGLWYYYYGKVHDILAQRGLYVSGWEEIAMRKTHLNGEEIHIPNPDFVNKGFTSYIWNTVWGRGNEDLPYRMANAGYKVVLASASNFYLDLAYTTDADEHGHHWAGYVDTDKPFYFNPYDYYKIVKEDYAGKPYNRKKLEGLTRLTDYGKTNIVGLQALLWSERVNRPGQLEYMLFPRLLAFAERAWAASPEWAEEKDEEKSARLYAKAWARFANTLGKKELPRLDHYLGGINYRIPPAGIMVADGMMYLNTQFPGLSVRYTLNGQEPTLKNSLLYKGPLKYNSKIKAKVFNTTGRSSKTTGVE